MLGTKRQEELFRSFAVAHALSASLNVAGIGAALASADLHRTSELARRQSALHDRIAAFDALYDTNPNDASLPIRLVPIGDELTAIGGARLLLERGFYLSAVFFPTVAKDRAALRICLTADHSNDDIIALTAALGAAVPKDLAS